MDAILFFNIYLCEQNKRKVQLNGGDEWEIKLLGSSFEKNICFIVLF